MRAICLAFAVMAVFEVMGRKGLGDWLWGRLTGIHRSPKGNPS